MLRFTVISVIAITMFALSLVVVPSALQGQPGPENGAKTISKLKLTVKSDKAVYSASSPIQFTLTLNNPTKEAIPITFATGQKYDVVIQKVGGGASQTVWQWSRGMMFTQMVTMTSLAPGKTMPFEVKFIPQDGTDVKPLAPGKYTVVGTITTMGAAQKPSAKATFTVK